MQISETLEFGATFRGMLEVCLAHRMTGGHLAIRAKSCFYNNTEYWRKKCSCVKACKLLLVCVLR